MSRVFVYLIFLAYIPALLAGEVNGVVSDMFGSPIDGASVSVVNTDATVQRTAASRVDGAFALGLLPPGAYAVTIRKQGYHQRLLQEVIDGQATTLSVALRHGRLFIAKVHVIRGAFPSRHRPRFPLTVKAVAVFDRSISVTATAAGTEAFTIRMSIPGDYFVGIEDEPPENRTKCRYEGNRDLFVDLTAKTCVLIER